MLDPADLSMNHIENVYSNAQFLSTFPVGLAAHSAICWVRSGWQVECYKWIMIAKYPTHTLSGLGM